MAIRRRLAVAYLIETAAPADYPPVPPCRRRGEPGCLAAWLSVQQGQYQRASILLDRAVVHDDVSRLQATTSADRHQPGIAGARADN